MSMSTPNPGQAVPLHGMTGTTQTAAVIGGGIVGLAVARELTMRYPALSAATPYVS
jgi:hypothetical protein